MKKKQKCLSNACTLKNERTYFTAVKESGFGIYIESVFLGCILCANLLSVSCTGLQQMVNVCAEYGWLCDIRFMSLAKFKTKLKTYLFRHSQ